MNRRRLILAIALGVAAVLAGYFYYRHAGEAALSPVTAVVSRGDVVEAVDATGTLEPVTTVQVGTQVSGTIKSLLVDFNDTVRRGQVIAELDPSLLRAQVEQAAATVTRLDADVERARVEVQDAQAKLGRARELSNQKLIAQSDFEAAQTTALQAAAALTSAQAQLTQGRASLNQARVNLGHTVITAPIDGIVISRNVDVGQTVAASMQAPTLFVLARDLTRMQVRASVSEADIGRIQRDQGVTFTVDAYPGRRFTGTVSQVRLEPVVSQNVVSYTTVIDVPNPDMRLKPGMTANVTVEIARNADVLRVPNAALRFTPSAELFAALGQTPPPAPDAARQVVPTTGDTRADDGGEGAIETVRAPRTADASRAAREDGSRRTRLWVLRGNQLEPVHVRTGISDGVTTAILAGELEEGDHVVTGASSASGTVQTPTRPTSPLLPSRRGRQGAGSSGGGGRR